MPSSLDIELCFLNDFDSVESALKTGLGISKTRIKKQLSKDFLNLSVDKGKSYRFPIDLINHGIINPNYQGPEIEILFEDENLIALNKPHNIHCHPLTYSEKNNCLSYLRENSFFKKSEFCHDRNLDSGLLYRLDLGTSGVLFLVKNKKDYEAIRQNFSTLAKAKKYLAIVEGKLEQEGEFKHFFKAHGEKGKKIIVSDAPFEGASLGPGKIKIKVLSHNKDLSLVSIELGAGIRHQIRAQLSHMGHPILGDTFYGGKKGDRLFLHAYKYQINLEDKVYEIMARNTPLFGQFFNLDGIF
ncbi:MAG: hypothetical protein DRQ88_05000 [Epsilonproteobacteria bacterium]|nr:MAG: hypothetical protein DRQ88_05000 [Campylobacterota bacterium]